MRQLLLRVPDDLHRRLSARAARAGRSINAMATQILESAVDADDNDRRARLRARAVALGTAAAVPSRPLSATKRRAIIESSRGIGAVIDAILEDERGRV